jgi:hypothetical protein
MERADLESANTIKKSRNINGLARSMGFAFLTLMKENDMATDMELTRKVKIAPSRDWADLYFDLVKQVLKVTKLKGNDPRLLMSLRPYDKHTYFQVTINRRYVLDCNIKKIKGNNTYAIESIFTSKWKDIPELRNNRHVKLSFQFGNVSGEHTEPPCYLSFDNIYEFLLLLNNSDKVKKSWVDALRAELKRTKAYTGRKVHDPKLYKLATDSKFRAKILGSAFRDGAGGMGEPETNRATENAAISYVTKFYQDGGWSVKSVESENCGFDLLCKSGKIQHHVEVKGIRGKSVSFIITVGETERAKVDKNFVLCAVTSALEDPQLHRWTAKEFAKKFTLEAISYRASLRI